MIKRQWPAATIGGAGLVALAGFGWAYDRDFGGEGKWVLFYGGLGLIVVAAVLIVAEHACGDGGDARIAVTEEVDDARAARVEHLSPQPDHHSPVRKL